MVRDVDAIKVMHTWLCHYERSARLCVMLEDGSVFSCEFVADGINRFVEEHGLVFDYRKESLENQFVGQYFVLTEEEVHAGE